MVIVDELVESLVCETRILRDRSPSFTPLICLCSSRKSSCLRNNRLRSRPLQRYHNNAPMVKRKGAGFRHRRLCWVEPARGTLKIWKFKVIFIDLLFKWDYDGIGIHDVLKQR